MDDTDPIGAAPGPFLALTTPASSRAVSAAAEEAEVSLVAVQGLSALLERLREQPWAATLLSLSVEHVDETVAERVAREPNAGVLYLSSPAVSLDQALLVERLGARAILHEPLSTEQLKSRFLAVTDEGPSIPLQAVADQSLRASSVGPVLVGESPAMAEVFEVVAKVARSPATVLVTGESGTGKEVVARAIHWASDRKDEPFVAVNCAAIPEHLLESELFGHERGAFTGAVARRVGRFERASGGTLFLDEIGDMSLVLQAKVLRVIEDRMVEPVGGQESRPVDVRLVAATNQALSDRIEEGLFREDLYYRLAVVEMHLPPLRSRGSDVRALALHFVAEFALRYDSPIRAVSEAALRSLRGEQWPGNVRELRNALDRAVLFSSGPVLLSSDLSAGVARSGGAAGAPERAPQEFSPTTSLQEVEATHIRRVLEFVDWQVGRAAEILGIHRNTLARKVREYVIRGGSDGELER